MLTLRFKKDAWDAFAKELRRASWGAAAIAGAIGLRTSSGVAAALGALAWAALQILAITVQSTDVRREEKE